MRLSAVYVAANEAGLIGDSIRSVVEYADRIVVVDSVFHGNPTPGTSSSDGQRAAAEAACQGRELVYIESPERLPEHAARNLALDQVPMGERALVIDADESLYGDHRRVLAELATESPVLYLWVYTAAIRWKGTALDMPEEVYARGPLIHTRGAAPRLVVRTPGLQVRSVDRPDGPTTHSDLFVGASPVTGIQIEQPFLVNHRARKSLEAYRTAYAWEVAQGGRPTTAFQRGEL